MGFKPCLGANRRHGGRSQAAPGARLLSFLLALHTDGFRAGLREFRSVFFGFLVDRWFRALGLSRLALACCNPQHDMIAPCVRQGALSGRP